jgi:hypothetical protein
VGSIRPHEWLEATSRRQTRISVFRLLISAFLPAGTKERLICSIGDCRRDALEVARHGRVQDRDGKIKVS